MSFRSVTVKKALNQISRHEYVLPAIQREFVWSSDQIARLFDSVLREFRIGTFLFWNVPASLSREFRFYDFMREYHELKARHSAPVPVTDPRSLTAVLDGQQRLTALNIGLLGYLATRRKYGRANNPAAYPTRHLHLDVCFDPASSGDAEALYRFEFLTEAEARRPTPDARWFRVGDILDLKEASGIFRWVQQQGLGDHPSAFPTLDLLWRGVHVREVISFFEDESDSIDRVLEIFIRTNSGGTVLSKSDLLLSVATAQFTVLDARAVVHGLVDDMNDVGQGFSFSKDLVLKAGLLVTDRSQIQFQVDAFSAENVAVLEAQWDRIDRALRIGVRLLASFGFSDRTLSAGSVLLPIVDYIAHRGLGDGYVDSTAERADRERIRQWVIRTLLKQGIWGSGLDTLLTRLRRAIREHGSLAFPVEALEREMMALGKTPRVTHEELEELVETPLDNRRAFPLLALLYPGIDVRNEFHLDHVFPRSRFTARKLGEAGIPGDVQDLYQDLRDRLPNLQLLEGSVNTSKQATLPLEWVHTNFPDPSARGGWLAAHDLTHLPAELSDFLDFYDQRRKLMLDRLHRLVGGAGSPGEEETAAEPALASARGVRRDGGSSGFTARQHLERRLSDVPDGEVAYRHRGIEYRAEIRGDRIVLSDGRTFDSPSAAGSAVNGGISVNGWRVWQRDGRPLADHVESDRRQLLAVPTGHGGPLRGRELTGAKARCLVAFTRRRRRYRACPTGRATV